MDAGVVAFKLCDRAFDCEHCPFDRAIRGGYTPADELESAESDAQPSPESGSSGQTELSRAEEVVRRFFNALLAMPFPSDRIFHRGHTWTQQLPDGSIRVGLDHLASGFLGTASAVVLPPQAALLVETMPFAWIVQQEGSHILRAPVSGRLAERNAAVMEHPHLTSADPYGEGWLVRLSGAEAASATDAASAAAAARRAKRELAGLRSEVLTHLRQMVHAGATLYDGGRRVSALPDLLGPKKLFQVAERLFSV
jgi:glycine cleavage system H lipoate-binding protein